MHKLAKKVFFIDVNERKYIHYLYIITTNFTNFTFRDYNRALVLKHPRIGYALECH